MLLLKVHTCNFIQGLPLGRESCHAVFIPPPHTAPPPQTHIHSGLVAARGAKGRFPCLEDSRCCSLYFSAPHRIRLRLTSPETSFMFASPLAPLTPLQGCPLSTPNKAHGQEPPPFSAVLLLLGTLTQDSFAVVISPCSAPQRVCFLFYCLLRKTRHLITTDRKT